MSGPPSHPVLLRLAHALLRKAERSQGGRTVSLKLDAEVLPELHQADSPAVLEHLALLLDQLAQTGWVALRLDKARAFQTLADRQPTLVLQDAVALSAWSGFTPTPPRWSRQLVEALREPGVLQVPNVAALLDYLLRNPLPWFEFRPPAECAATLNALAVACESGQSLYLRELSARHFRGHSKVLDAREELLRLLGAADGQFLEAPIQLLVSLPERRDAERPFDEVLFVENLVSFERMTRHRQLAWAQAALVFASGFKGTARRLRARPGSSVYWQGLADPDAADAWTRWLYDGPASDLATLPVRFYGDLDFAGLQILAQLRQSFPSCQAWESGYTALLAMLEAGQGHAPAMAGKEGQGDPGMTGCGFADERLLPALRRSGRCVDQECWPMTLA